MMKKILITVASVIIIAAISAILYFTVMPANIPYGVKIAIACAVIAAGLAFAVIGSKIQDKTNHSKETKDA